MSIKLDIKTKSFIKKLGKYGNLLQIVAAETVNESANEIAVGYQHRIVTNQTVRTPFTIRGIKIFKSNPIRKSGEPRPLGKINAIVGVIKMKGGKKHYLAKLEDGVTQTGNPTTLGKVPVPLNAARISGKENKSISGKNRLDKVATQTLSIGGKKIGVAGDGFNARRRWGMIYAQKRSGFSRTQGDPRQPFFFFDIENVPGIFKFIGNTLRQIRDLSQSTVRTKRKTNFKDEVVAMRPEKIQKKFIKKAARRLSSIK